jgi:hypothetical protein
MEYEQPIFGQLNYFAGELLRMIDEGQTVSIEDVCDNIEKGTIVQFIKTRCGFKNLNVTVESVKGVNDILKNKYVSDNEAQNMGINNGLVYIMRLIIDDLNGLLYDMKWTDVDSESYRRLSEI